MNSMPRPVSFMRMYLLLIDTTWVGGVVRLCCVGAAMRAPASPRAGRVCLRGELRRHAYSRQ